MTGIQDLNKDLHEQAEAARRAAYRNMGRAQRSWERLKQPLREFAFEYIFRNPYQFSVPGEIGIYSERRNLVSIVGPLVGELTMFVIAVLGVVASESLAPFFAVAGVIALILFTYGLIEWFVTRLFISDRRMYEITGFFSVNVDVLPLSKVTDMTYTQSFIGKLFRYGHVRVETAGQDQALSRIMFLRRPEEFYKVATALALGKDWKRVTKVLRLPPDVPVDMAIDSREEATEARLADEAKRAEAEAERIKGENERLKVEQARWELQAEIQQVRAERQRMQRERLANEAESARQQGIGRPADKQARTDRLIEAEERARLSELSAGSAESDRRRAEGDRRKAEIERQSVEQSRLEKEETQRKVTLQRGSIGGMNNLEVEKARKGIEDAHAEDEKDKVVVERHRQADEWARVVDERERMIELYQRLMAEGRRLEIEQRLLTDPDFEVDPDEELEFIAMEERIAERERDVSRAEDRRTEEEQRRFERERERTVLERARLSDVEEEDRFNREHPPI